MPQAVGEIGLRGTTLDAMLLPRGVRVVTTSTITAASAIAEGARTASLRASATTQITAGTGLSFNVTTPSGATRRKQVIVRQDVELNATAQNVTIFPAIEAVAANETAVFIPGLIPVFGLQDFSFQSQDTTVDTTDTLSGAGTEVAIVRSGLEFTISVIERIADKGLTNIIKPVALDFAFKGREIFARLMYPDGETHQGAAKVMNYSQAGNQNEVKRANWTLQFQGESYDLIKAYTFGAFSPSPAPGGGGTPTPTPPAGTTVRVNGPSNTTTTDGDPSPITFTSTNAASYIEFTEFTSTGTNPIAQSIYFNGNQVALLDYFDGAIGQTVSMFIQEANQTRTITLADRDTNFSTDGLYTP